MDLEKTTEQSAEQQDDNRDGYSKPAGTDYHSTERSMRPRIHSQRAYSSDKGGYNSNKPGNNDGGFRPEGFGVGLQNSEGANRGGYGNNRGGYNHRGGYNSNHDGYNNHGGYNNRGDYNNSGYNNDRGGYSNDRGGYNNNRGGYNNNRGGGYRPRYNNGGDGDYQAQDGNDRGGYNNNRGGYNNNRGVYNNNRGGYNQGGYNNNRGGYNQGVYNNNRGGYNHGVYNNNRGGYNNNRGGYNNNRGGYGNNGGYNNNYGGYNQHSQDYDPNAKYSLKKRIEYKEENIDPNEPIRLNKYLANAGVCSRREADEFIAAGVVSVNGAVVTELGSKVLRTDEVKFHDQLVSLEKKVYVLLNKPKDYVTTSDDPQQRKTVMDLVNDACPERIYPVGRLDRNTTGVLLLTNDGDMASKLTHPKFLKKKVYHVYLDKPVSSHDMQQISEGITLEDGEIHADAIEYADERDKKQIGIEIHSGKNRIVRRIFESLGYRVIKLDRVQFAGLTKKNLRRGDWRFLTEKEVEMLRMGAFE